MSSGIAMKQSIRKVAACRISSYFKHGLYLDIFMSSKPCTFLTCTSQVAFCRQFTAGFGLRNFLTSKISYTKRPSVFDNRLNISSFQLNQRSLATLPDAYHRLQNTRDQRQSLEGNLGTLRTLLSNELAAVFIAKRHMTTDNQYQHNSTNNTGFNVGSARLKVQDGPRSVFKGRVSGLKNSILYHKIKLKDKLKGHRLRGVQAVRSLRKQVESKKEDVRTIPNLLTSLRMVSAPVLAYLVLNESYGIACSIFIIAGITDVVDGYIARNFKNQRTALGTALDPLADKLLVSFLTVSLTYVGLIPVMLTALIISRDLGLIAATFYVRYISLSPPRTLSRYFDVSHVTAKLYPSNISKLNTLVQLSYVAATLASPVLDCVNHPLLQALMVLTATTTFLSGADYLLTWRRRLKIIKNK